MLKKTESEVWVVTYDHKHGQDLSVYDSERAADEAIREMMRESLMGQEDDKSLDDIREKLAKDVTPDDWGDRFSEYFSYQHCTVNTWHDNLETMGESIRASTPEPSSAATPAGKPRRTAARRRT